MKKLFIGITLLLNVYSINSQIGYTRNTPDLSDGYTITEKLFDGMTYHFQFTEHLLQDNELGFLVPINKQKSVWIEDVILWMEFTNGFNKDIGDILIRTWYDKEKNERYHELKYFSNTSEIVYPIIMNRENYIKFINDAFIKKD